MTECDKLTMVTLTLCACCLDGLGGECHVPGCALWMNRAPDVAIRSKVEPMPLTPERVGAELAKLYMEWGVITGWGDRDSASGPSLDEFIARISELER